ncbi:ubiquinol-cytochrome-c reductase complex assembly factor 1 [Homalodisca vitripennis]|uniref:ubiquinol-cytochrome-c reductase complex assembly factor 1 n=1 Tax=Homalodisca vitripennis TaxID=197043 RepID=UPI001EE9BC29|nr:ubiquinol-cytochrome-c reductase complex assembly factor 1 [Homalodisca vitripennis]
MNSHLSVIFYKAVEMGMHRTLCLTQLPRIQSILYPIQHRHICLSQSHQGAAAPKSTALDGNIFGRTLKKIKFYTVGKVKLKVLGYYLYECVADKVPYTWFFKEMSLPDTFNSWFLVTELHIWMLMVKAMELGDDGRFIRNFIVEAMWADVAMKSKKLGAENYSLARAQTKILGDQFQAALITYDEGLLCNDKVLASALWRRFFEKNCNDPRNLETMVKYVRMQIKYLDNMTEEDFRKRNIKWQSIEKT